MITLVGIQQAAVRTFADRGYAATSIRDIAAAAGVTSGALYLHVSSKMEILESVMHLALDELLRVATQATEGDRAPAERLEGLVRAHVAVQATNPRTARVVDGELRILPEAQRRAMIGKRDTYERLWTEAIEDGRRTGAFAVDDVSIARLALVEMCNGVADWYLPGGPFPLDRIQEIFVRLSFNMLRYTGPAYGADPRLEPRLLACEPVGRGAAG